jgi:hypothetical protein
MIVAEDSPPKDINAIFQAMERQGRAIRGSWLPRRLKVGYPSSLQPHSKIF